MAKPASKEPSKETEVVTIRLPLHLVRWVDAMAIVEHRTRSNMITVMLEQILKAEQDKQELARR